jgi:hypothetical protein
LKYCDYTVCLYVMLIQSVGGNMGKDNFVSSKKESELKESKQESLKQTDASHSGCPTLKGTSPQARTLSVANLMTFSKEISPNCIGMLVAVSFLKKHKQASTQHNKCDNSHNRYRRN